MGNAGSVSVQLTTAAGVSRSGRAPRPSDRYYVDIFLPDHPGATNGPIAFCAMALAAFRHIKILDPIEVPCCGV
jgi:hypothetical protein